MHRFFASMAEWEGLLQALLKSGHGELVYRIRIQDHEVTQDRVSVDLSGAPNPRVPEAVQNAERRTTGGE